MRRALTTTLLLAPTLVGQSWSLASRLPAPTAYLAVDASFARRLREVVPTSALPTALREAGFDRRAREVALLSRICDLCDGTMEVALGGTRDLIVHCELPAGSVERVQALIDGPAMQPLDRVGDAAIVGMSSDGPNAAPGLCLSLSGNHLLVANAVAPIAKLLSGPASAATLLDDADFRDLSRRVGGDRPALTLFSSFADLGAVLVRAAAPAARAQLAASGMRDARSVVVAVRPVQGGFSTTVLVRRAEGAALDGWLALTQRLPLASLLLDLPRGGLASLTLALDPKVVRKSDALPTVSAVYGALAGGCADFGLSLEQQVLARLKGPAGVQLMVTAAHRVGAAYIAKAKSERDAERLLDDCRKFVAARAPRTAEPGAADELVVPMPLAGAVGRLRVVRDHVVLTSDRAVSDLVAGANAGEAGGAPRWVSQAFKNLPGASRQPVVGVLIVDLGDLLPEADREATTLRQHAGLLRLQPDHLRLELYSQL
jgi:hypothetical protein